MLGPSYLSDFQDTSHRLNFLVEEIDFLSSNKLIRLIIFHFHLMRTLLRSDLWSDDHIC